MVVGLQRQVLAIVVGVRGVIQRKGAAGGDAQRGGGAPDLLMLGLPASGARGRRTPLLMFGVAARPVVDVNLPRRRRDRVLPRTEQPAFGLRKS